jgi:hypothetical protein
MRHAAAGAAAGDSGPQPGKGSTTNRESARSRDPEPKPGPVYRPPVLGERRYARGPDGPSAAVIALSACAEIVRVGLTPSDPGIADPSTT